MTPWAETVGIGTLTVEWFFLFKKSLLLQNGPRLVKRKRALLRNLMARRLRSRVLDRNELVTPLLCLPLKLSFQPLIALGVLLGPNAFVILHLVFH